MARIILCYRKDLDKRGAVMHSYAESMDRVLSEDHDILRVGIGHEVTSIDQLEERLIGTYDLLLDVDCGRAKDGELHFQVTQEKKPTNIKTAVRFIDTHGHPSFHRRLAKHYDHVFFAVYARRDLFANHPSAHWLPNASDDRWFDYTLHLRLWSNPKNMFGFFGSKGGLDRADDLVALCTSHNFTFDVREVGAINRNRWPTTSEAMANCKFLYNRGQKHDGPNQRVIESMLMCRPLITDRDKTDGMSELFEEGTHYLGYESLAELSLQMHWCIENEELARSMAKRAYELAKSKHLIKHRIDQMLEVCLG